MMIPTIFLAIQVVLILGLFVASGSYKQTVKEANMNVQLGFMIPASLFLIDKVQLIRRIPWIFQQAHFRILRLYKNDDSFLFTKIYLAQLLSAFLLTFTIFTFFSVAAGDTVLFYFGLFVALLVLYALYQDLEKKIKKREQDILLELPKMLNKVLLLINAGENVQKALMQTVEQANEISNPLYIELRQAAHELRLNRSFYEVMEDFSRRCGVQEVSVFLTTLLLNYRRGGNNLAVALEGLSKELWDKRKGVSRTLGEEASSKLVFPMVIIFVVVLIIVAFPAIKLMQ
jgi:tight adherence protein C